jgi:hypothetical protein
MGRQHALLATSLVETRKGKINFLQLKNFFEPMRYKYIPQGHNLSTATGHTDTGDPVAGR